MSKYFFTECKRLAKYLPGALLVTVLLLGALAGVLGMTLNRQSQREENNKFPIGVVGSLDDPLLQMGVEAMRNYDSSRFAIELVPTTEDQAKRDLARGEISAYLVVPDGFMDSAMHGTILPIRFVSTLGSAGLSSVMQREVTETVSRFLLDAQKGVYGMYETTEGAGGSHMTDMALRYTEYILARDRLYRVENLGIGDGLDLGGYLTRGFLVLFLMLGCLPFAPAMIRKDPSLGKVLASKGRPAFLQALCSFAAYCLAHLALVLAVGAVSLCVPGLKELGALLLGSVPAAVLAAALSYFVYTLATDLISGVLLQFFVTVSLCFVSGCLYPVYFFPTALQQAAVWLPTGAARVFLAEGSGLILVLGYSLAFFLAGSFLYCRRIRGVRG